MSPRSAVSEPEPESPGDSGTDLRHDQPQHREEEHSEEEQDPKMQIPTIGIRSDLLPTHPVPKMDLDLNHLGSLQGLPALEALRRQAGNTNSFLSNLPGSPIMPNFSQGRPSQPPTPQSTGSQDMGSGSWTFEEQFKQLYEIDDNPARREFLDELFAFMQKRGTPINRLPIMAKQVLDLYELYNLVVARGGLVEVINKKQWQEIIKGLGLPSSITSAAFTLRTQYTKYLYPLECKNNSFSNPNDLQSAIEGNKREGRTSSFGPYGGMPMQNSPLPPSLGGGIPFSMMTTMSTPPRPLHMNGNRPPMHPGSRSPPGLPTGPQDPLSAFEMTRLALLKMYNQTTGMGDPRPPLSLPNMPLPPDLPGLHQDKAINLHVERQRALEEIRRKEEDNMMKMDADRKEMEEREQERDRQIRREMELKKDRLSGGGEEEFEEGVSPPPCKRSAGEMEDEEDEEVAPLGERQDSLIHNTIPGTNIKITTRGQGSDSSLVVSMELNGLTYQGILFQKPRS